MFKDINSVIRGFHTKCSPVFEALNKPVAPTHAFWNTYGLSAGSPGGAGRTHGKCWENPNFRFACCSICTL